jgi:Hint module
MSRTLTAAVVLLAAMMLAPARAANGMASLATASGQYVKVSGGGCPDSIFLGSVGGNSIGQASNQKNGKSCAGAGGSVKLEQWPSVASRLQRSVQGQAMSDDDKNADQLDILSSYMSIFARGQDSTAYTCGGVTSRDVYTFVDNVPDAWLSGKLNAIGAGGIVNGASNGDIFMQLWAAGGGYDAFSGAIPANGLELLPGGACWYKRTGSSASAAVPAATTTTGAPKTTSAGTAAGMTVSTTTSKTSAAATAATTTAKISTTVVDKKGTTTTVTVAKDGSKVTEAVEIDGKTTTITIAANGSKTTKVVETDGTTTTKSVATDGTTTTKSVATDGTTTTKSVATDGTTTTKSVATDGTTTTKSVTTDGTSTVTTTKADGKSTTKVLPADPTTTSTVAPTNVTTTAASDTADFTSSTDKDTNATTSSQSSNSASCFPASATVTLESGETIRMEALAVGDRVLVAANTFSTVFMFTHKDPAYTSSAFVRINTASGASLALTAGHYIHVNGGLSAASAVAPGDFLTLASGSADTVTSVETSVSATGLFNPQTVDGSIVVDGVRTSTYTTAVAPALAHALLAPLRRAYALLGASTAALESGAPALVALVPGGASVIEL